MTSRDDELIRRFLIDGSETAFAELVTRHLPLVYAAALRQLGNDAAGAEDVAQSVFIDLARKARSVVGRASIAGWLYTATRMQTSTHRRNEFRRRRREHQSHLMQELLGGDDIECNWDQLRPVLDDAMHELKPADREALISRFLENRPLAAVGSRLGIGENAARMRVDRAIDKLRQALGRRGIESSAAALAATLASKANAAPPPQLAARIVKAATPSMVPAGILGGITIAVIAFMAHTKVRAAIGAALLALATAVWIHHERHAAPASLAGSEAGDATPQVTGESTTAPESSAGGTLRPSATPLDEQGRHRMVLTVVAADSGSPVPGVRVEVESRQQGRSSPQSSTSFTTLRDGTCAITFPGDSSELNLTTRADHFADTHLNFVEARGSGIPAAYTIRLVRPAHLGGLVLDAYGQPVAGAKIGFFQETDQSLVNRAESHEYGFIVTTSDDAGRWEVERLAEDVISRTDASASHPDHVNSDYVSLGHNATALAEMRAGTFVFRLKRPLTLTGTVVNDHDAPVAGAKVFLGLIGESPKRSTTTDLAGNFSLPGAAPGPNRISANAEGYAPVTKSIDVKVDGQSVKFVMKAGQPLRFHVTDTGKKPISNAVLWLNPFSPDMQNGVQAEVTLRTDDSGDASWDDAPDSELRFSVTASGYMRLPFIRAKADGRVQNVVMQRALTVYGNVTDADTGRPIRQFTIISGWPTSSGNKIEAQWSNIDRFWLQFKNGTYRHTYEEGVVANPTNPGYILRFEADGYASFVSRVIAADEGDVEIDATLKRTKAPSITLLSPDGRPAANAQIGLIGPGGWATLNGPTIDPLTSGSLTRIVTDSGGKFSFSSDDPSVSIIVAVHPSGYALANAGDLTDQPNWSLQPYGVLRGSISKKGAPVPGREMVLHSFSSGGQPVRLDPQGFHATTDATGRYEFLNVPSGTWTLARQLQLSDGTHYISLSHATNVTIPPGGTSILDLAIGGGKVVANIRLPGLSDGRSWAVEGRMQPAVPGTASGSAAPSAASGEGERPTDPIPKYFSFIRQPDGSYAAEDVDPGTYLVEFYAIDQASASTVDPAADTNGTPARIATKILKANQGPVVVPDTSGTERTVDLGVIEPH